jgi:hypothetical protein
MTGTLINAADMYVSEKAAGNCFVVVKEVTTMAMVLTIYYCRQGDDITDSDNLIAVKTVTQEGAHYTNMPKFSGGQIVVKCTNYTSGSCIVAIDA